MFWKKSWSLLLQTNSQFWEELRSLLKTATGGEMHLRCRLCFFLQLIQLICLLFNFCRRLGQKQRSAFLLQLSPTEKLFHLKSFTRQQPKLGCVCELVQLKQTKKMEKLRCLFWKMAEWLDALYSVLIFENIFWVFSFLGAYTEKEIFLLVAFQLGYISNTIHAPLHWPVLSSQDRPDHKPEVEDENGKHQGDEAETPGSKYIEIDHNLVLKSLITILLKELWNRMLQLSITLNTLTHSLTIWHTWEKFKNFFFMFFKV